MANCKLFVSNLDFEITTEQLEEMFGEIGPCLSVVIATDRHTKRSKGFAFVEMESDEHAEKAIELLNNKSVNGRPVKVCEDRGKAAGVLSSDGKTRTGERRKFEQLPPIQRLQLFKRKTKIDPFLNDPTKTVDYRDIATLTRFMSDRGKILSRRLTGLSAYNQRKVAKAIKRSQNAGLIPFVNV